MRILMVTRETEADKCYGLGQSLLPLIAEFKHRGIEVDTICQADLSVRAQLWQGRLQRFAGRLLDKLNGRTDFAVLSWVLLERFNMGRLAAKACARQHYTHVHCHDPIIAAGYRFFSLLSGAAKARWGITEHGFGSYTQAICADGVRMGARVLALMCRWEAQILTQANWVAIPSHSAAEQLAKDLDFPSPPGHWQVIYHARPTINRYNKQQAREQLDWNDKTFYIVSVGRIAPVKQFPLLIAACAKAAHTEAIQLVILGEGDFEPLQTLAAQLNLERPIHFACTDDIGLYLSATDLYVSSSASESFGLANLEAMTAGAATLCTAVGAVPEIVGTGGILVDNDLDAIAAELRHLITDQDARHAIAERGLKRAESWPDRHTNADHYENMYRKNH